MLIFRPNQQVEEKKKTIILVSFLSFFSIESNLSKSKEKRKIVYFFKARFESSKK